MKSDYVYSRASQRMADDLDLSPDELAIIDLVSAGWEKKEAFKLIYRAGMTWNTTALKEAVDKIFAKDGAKKRRKFIKNNVVDYDPASKENVPRTDIEDPLEALSKENMLVDLMKARKTMEIGSKEWLDVNKMIADITRMKQDEVKTEDTTINYYLPITCHQCELYAKHKKE